jgi:hypothetical protein
MFHHMEKIPPCKAFLTEGTQHAHNETEIGASGKESGNPMAYQG